jgi:hypothetical protein
LGLSPLRVWRTARCHEAHYCAAAPPLPAPTRSRNHLQSPSNPTHGFGFQTLPKVVETLGSRNSRPVGRWMGFGLQVRAKRAWLAGLATTIGLGLGADGTLLTRLGGSQVRARTVQSGIHSGFGRAPREPAGPSVRQTVGMEMLRNAPDRPLSAHRVDTTTQTPVATPPPVRRHWRRQRKTTQSRTRRCCHWWRWRRSPGGASGAWSRRSTRYYAPESKHDHPHSSPRQG